MDVSIKSLFRKFAGKSTLVKLIIINCIVFLVIGILSVVAKLFELHIPNVGVYIEVASNLKVLVVHFWTPLTYMFVHYQFWHLLFNMIMLYWFGQIFLMYFTPKNLVALYILGGLAGAFVFILTFNTIPYFIKQGDVYMIGASASVMAIVFASAFYNKNQTIALLFIGNIKIVYIALFIFVLDFISLGRGSNLGGHVAHLGGAVLGYIFATQYLKGHDLTKWLNNCFDKVVNLFKPRPKMKITFDKRKNDYDYNQHKHSEDEVIDAILDKIRKSGYTNLTEKEKKQLFDASKK